jgi:hypothetical protein
MGLRSEKLAEPLICGVANQGFKTEPDGLRISARADGGSGFLQQFGIDIDGFLHTSICTISIWLKEQYGGSLGNE